MDNKIEDLEKQLEKELEKQLENELAMRAPAADIYATKQELNKEARSRAQNDALIINTVKSISTAFNAQKVKVDGILPLKQNIVDANLKTNAKNIVESINELKSVNDAQDQNISTNITDIEQNKKDIGMNDKNIKENKDEIVKIKAEYLKISDANKNFDEKQNKIDNNLKTDAKTIVESINELKSNSDSQKQIIAANVADIEQNKDDINQNTSSINKIKVEYLKIVDANKKFDEKQNKNDNNLKTDAKMIVESINELKSANDVQEKNISTSIIDIKENKDEIVKIKAEYLKIIEANKIFDEKQNKIDNNLKTDAKTIVASINELKSVNDAQEKNIGAGNDGIKEVKDEIVKIKVEYLKIIDANKKFDEKQNITDNHLRTDAKTIVESINELKSVNDAQDQNISKNNDAIQENKKAISKNSESIKENKADIITVKAEYLKITDANVRFDEKQHKFDNTLKTDSKSIVESINELKSVNDAQDQNISTNTNNIKQNIVNIEANKTDIVTIKKDYLKITDANKSFDEKQNKIDNNLLTSAKTIVESINELKSVNDAQEKNIGANTNDIQKNRKDVDLNSKAIRNNNDAIQTNTSEISKIKKDYLKITEADERFDKKQDQEDEALTTDAKTIVNSINEINLDKVSKDEYTVFQETMTLFQNNTATSLGEKQNVIDTKLTTNAKNIVAAINELNARISSLEALLKKDKSEDGKVTN